MTKQTNIEKGGKDS